MIHMQDALSELSSYRKTGDENARKSKYPNVRLRYYQDHPEDERAIKDFDARIRTKFFLDHPQDKRAKLDFEWKIRRTYYQTNILEVGLKTKGDHSAYVRAFYYHCNPSDKDGAFDNSTLVKNAYHKARMCWLTENPSLAIKDDLDYRVRILYYIEHSDDRDGYLDKDYRVVEAFKENRHLWYRRNDPYNKRLLRDDDYRCRAIYYSYYPKSTAIRNERDERVFDYLKTFKQ